MHDYIDDEIIRPSKFKRLFDSPSMKLGDKSCSDLYGKKKKKNLCSTCGYKGQNRRLCRNESHIAH